MYTYIYIYIYIYIMNICIYRVTTGHHGSCLVSILFLRVGLSQATELWRWVRSGRVIVVGSVAWAGFARFGVWPGWIKLGFAGSGVWPGWVCQTGSPRPKHRHLHSLRFCSTILDSLFAQIYARFRLRSPGPGHVFLGSSGSGFC